MIAASSSRKHYASARKRFLQASIERFFELEFARLFGPFMREQIALRLVELVEEQMPPRLHLRSGQCVWNAVAVETRPDSPKLRLVPVVLTLVDDTDTALLADGARPRDVLAGTIARMMEEAFEQGALLSTRDLALLLGHDHRYISSRRRAWEDEHHRTLPHPGSLQDFGSCLSHKLAIIVKVVYEKKSTRQVASETKHTQRAVDRYLKDFYRIRTCYNVNPDIEFISRATGLSSYLINQYLQIIENYEKTA
jgi:hypothetical protein